MAASPGPRRWYYTSSGKSTWFVLSCKQYRYVRVRPHTAMLYYTHNAFCLTYFTAWGGCTKKHGIHFRHKTRGKIIVPPLVKLRHAKVVVSRQYPRKKLVSGMHSSRYRIVWCFFSRQDSLETYRRCVNGVLCCCCGP